MKRLVLSGVECYPTLGQPGTQVVEHQVRDALDLRLGSGLNSASRTAPSPKSRPNFPRFSSTARLLKAMYVSTLRGQVQTRQGGIGWSLGQGRGA